jgi:iron complex outermembrane receptor protein
MNMHHTKGRNAAHQWIMGSTFAAIVAAPPVHAQEMLAANTSSESTMRIAEEIIVTGTRRTGMAAADSPAPIQLLDTGTLEKVGQPDLIQALAQNVPSFSAQAFGGDTAALTLSAKLRGLSPNHALVLINGKRRHTTANLAVLSGAYQGGAAADLSFIPVAAIERIEVLQDGAAAQYGTDAIAGVVNIILKNGDDGGKVGASTGGYFDGGGDTYDATGNIGFGSGDGTFLNLTTEVKYHDRSERGGIDPRVVDPTNLANMPQLRNMPGYPKVNLIQGDAEYRLSIATFNAGMNVGDATELYSFGSYGRKHAKAYENYRMPNRIPDLYPLGFNPQEESKEQDYGVTVGIKGTAFGEWRWDLATTYGKDDVEINTIKSGNVSLYNDTGFTPTDFHAGDFIATQWTTNFDMSREFEVGMAGPLNVAFGLEQREESYEIKPGDEFARYKEGSQSFPGFALTDAGKHDRDNVAAYVDFAFSPVDKLQLDVAGRYEDFSDFGDASVGKLTGRYDFTEQFAMRGTFSTGFRAPTLAEEYYSATNVSPSSAFVQLPPNSPAAALIGVKPLKAEKSTNFSIGLVMRPTEGVTMTLDAYQIEVDDRVVGSGSLYGLLDGEVVSPAVTAAIAANGNVLDPDVETTGINVFSNGLDTRTQGAELVVAFDSDFDGWGTVDWSIAANYNHTEVTRIKEAPAQLAPQSLFDRTAIADLETAFPEYRVVMGATWTLDKFSATLRETVFGEASTFESRDGTNYYKNEIGVTPITDLELSYQFTDAVKFSLGANNLFNEYPDQKNPALLADYRSHLDNSAVAIYPSFSSFGINGGYYYGKLGFSF